MEILTPQLLDAIVMRLVACCKPEQIILFGSHAYGIPNQDSDIDLLVIVSQSDQPRYRRARDAYGALWGLAAPAEIVVMTRHEVEKSKTVKSSLVHQAIHKGKVLYG
jgi:uncharacterized protein